MTEKGLEDKFDKEFKNHRIRYLGRMFFEPGYNLRDALSISKSEKQRRQKAIGWAIPSEVIRLGLYGFIAYATVDYLLK